MFLFRVSTVVSPGDMSLQASFDMLSPLARRGGMMRSGVGKRSRSRHDEKMERERERDRDHAAIFQAQARLKSFRSGVGFTFRS